MEAAENMVIAAGKGAKAQKIGLKEQASRWSSAYPIACRCRLWWESPQRDAGRAGRLCRKPAARPCRPFPCPTASGEDRAADAPSSTTPPRLGRASCPMIRIAISADAFEAIARTLPLASVGYEDKTDQEASA
jgi:hypothetical protein